MTVIAAATKNGTSSIACDSKVTGPGKGVVMDSKIFDATYGFVGIAGDASTWVHLKEVPIPTSASDKDWMDYLERIRGMLARNASPFGGGSLCLAVNARSIHIIHPSGVFRQTLGIGAIGSGGDVALGRMSAETRKMMWNPKSVVRAGVESAIKHAEGCDGPVVVKSI
jgi:ATP-dependent protease HslVU (ClpYQ) peptidase subunit